MFVNKQEIVNCPNCRQPFNAQSIILNGNDNNNGNINLNNNTDLISLALPINNKVGTKLQMIRLLDMEG